MIPWNDSAPASRLSWASITPFGLPVVPDVNTSSNTSSGCRALPRLDLRLPVGREVVARVLGQRLDRRGGEALEADLARVRRVAAGAEQQALRARRLDDVRIASVLIRESSGT